MSKFRFKDDLPKLTKIKTTPIKEEVVEKTEEIEEDEPKQLAANILMCPACGMDFDMFDECGECGYNAFQGLMF